MNTQNNTTYKTASIRTITLWLLSNLGGTLWLTGYFAVDRLADYSIALFTGLLAAIVSLTIIPVIIPFFALIGRLSSEWLRCAVALAGITLLFLLANKALLFLLPVDSLPGLLEISVPYLGAALLTAGWMYKPARLPFLVSLRAGNTREGHSIALG